jgi:phage FluMu gp28-like protein
MPEPTLSAYFLPYQIAWLKDSARLKIVEKSRRIGMTYVQSYEDVRDAVRAEGAMDVWFSSADLTAAKEYIHYCKLWTDLFRIAAEDLGEIVLDKDSNVRGYAIQFASGKRVTALSSNPGSFRSKGGKVVLDEFAKHAQQDELWKAAQPSMLWGYPIRVISTYLGKGNRYYRMVQEAKQPGGSLWHLHSTTLPQAVEQGLADKIVGRPLSDLERQAWIEEARQMAGDEETWQQEYLCNPVDEATAWLPWDLITSAEHPVAGQPEGYGGGYCYLGWDIARRRDLSVLWVLEAVGDVLWTREVVSLKGCSFAQQQAEFDRLFDSYRILRAGIDQTGMGEVIVEANQQKYGSRVEGILFSGAAKQSLATLTKQKFEDRLLRIPADRAIRDSFHAIRKTNTSTGAPRFDADRSEVGHADEFWSCALAIHAASGATMTIDFQAIGRPRYPSPAPALLPYSPTSQRATYGGF